MIIKLSQKQKIVADYGLAAIGMVISQLVHAGVLGALVGLVGGFLVSDLTTFVDAGSVSQQQVLQQTVQAVSAVAEQEAAQQAQQQKKA